MCAVNLLRDIIYTPTDLIPHKYKQIILNRNLAEECSNLEEFCKDT